jgi:hypothetical protein
VSLRIYPTVTDALNGTELDESEKAVAGQRIVACATTSAVQTARTSRGAVIKAYKVVGDFGSLALSITRNGSTNIFEIMKTAVAGVLLASSAALLTGCAAYPDAPGYGSGYYSSAPVYDEPGYGYYGAPPVAQPNVVFGSGYYYGPGPNRYWDDGPGWRGRPPGYGYGGPPPNRGWHNGPPPNNGGHGGPPPQAGGGRPPAGGSPGAPPPQAGGGGGQVPQSVGGVRPRPPAPAANNGGGGGGGGGNGGGRSRGGAPMNGSVQPLQH